MLLAIVGADYVAQKIVINKCSTNASIHQCEIKLINSLREVRRMLRIFKNEREFMATIIMPTHNKAFSDLSTQ